MFRVNPAADAACLGITELELKQIDTIWEMGCSSLAVNSNELVMPDYMSKNLSEKAVEILKTRLSEYLNGAATMAFVDAEARTFRVAQLPPTPSIGDSLSAYPTPGLSPSSPGSVGSEQDHFSVTKTRTLAKKKTPPRPPNSFILYRQQHHPLVKRQNPNMHNNDVSIMLGKQWRDEPESVKAKYKALAEDYKREHAAKNPGYQYAPRKPSEKKRRMTARKLARLAEVESPQAIGKASFSQDAGMADHDAADFDDVFDFNDPGSKLPSIPKKSRIATTQDINGTRRPVGWPRLRTDHLGAYTLMDLPSRNEVANVVQANNASIAPESVLPYSPGNADNNMVTTTPAAHANNDQAFFDSLVDWEAIAEDFERMHTITAEEEAYLEGVELGDSFLTLSDEMKREAFKKELERIAKMWKP